MFRPVPPQANFPQQETAVLDLWRERKIYEKSLARPSPAGPFVFFEGPPTANGKPHPGHCLTRAIKDLFPRYRTMRGYCCLRKAGWDTHGLPVEVEVCKELGIHSKEEIEAYGIEPFIHKCQQSVWRYMQEWERLTERLGFWVDLKQAYVTYHKSFVESVWWSLKTLFDQGLLYQGHKIVWWWAQGGTALSSGEVGQGYRQVADPSVYVRFPIVVDEKAKSLGLDENTSLLVWTTTPWTLPSNQFAAVHPDLEYVVVVDEHDGKTQKLLIATALSETLSKKIGRELVVASTLKGSDLVDLSYLPPFDYYRSRSEGWGMLYRRGNAAAMPDENRAKHLEEFRNGGMCTWQRAWRVVVADFVTTDSGTGIVHIAPAFGEVDFDVLQRIQRDLTTQSSLDLFYQPALICAVGPDGKFTKDAPEYEGRWVKEADKDIARNLRDRGLMWHREEYLHDYPFCWRAEEDPLIQYPRKSWFIKTSRFKDEMLANNARINWLPEHIRDGRFGNFLESNVDWALSRERYWGTPLPIWVCQETGKMEAVGSYAELLAKPGVKGTEAWAAAKQATPALPDDLMVHKPYIDEVTYDSPFAPGAHMRRVSEVIDCWYDSGAMPFAQWGYPHQGRDEFQNQFPADFISEAIDQTRGWFYSQLAISTLLFGNQQSAVSSRQYPYPHPFRNCIVLGLMLGEDGQKMSKSKRNYREPSEIFDKYGADALRWYFFANAPPWTTLRYSEQAIKESIPEFLLRLWNCYSFFVIYANIDGFQPEGSGVRGQGSEVCPPSPLAGEGPGVRGSASPRPVKDRSELDRWILSEVHRTTAAVTGHMDEYRNYEACQALTALVDALSNWYVRRSRDRFWSEDKHDADKRDAYWTLYECLLTVTKLIAPFTPFVAETMWQNLAVAGGGNATESVHLCDYPTADPSVIDEQLSTRMNLVREIVSLGRSARMGAKLKVRQPLAKVEICLADATHQPWLAEHAELIAEELNVKRVEFAVRADDYVQYTVLPDLKKLGPKLGKRLPLVKQALTKVDAAALLQQLESAQRATLELADGPQVLEADEVQVRLQAKSGWAASHGPAGVVVVSTEVTPELVAEGLARDFVHSVQTIRKDLNCAYTDRLSLGIVGDGEAVAAIRQFADYVKGETLATSLDFAPIASVEPVEASVGGQTVQLYVQVRKS